MAHPLADAIRSEHRTLFTQLESFREALYDPAMGPDGSREVRVREIVGWMKDNLLPHAAEEEAHLYPAVDELAGSAGARATETMLMDHDTIRRLVQQLDEVLADPTSHGARHADWVQMLGAQLEMALTLHFRKEEDIYLRLLDSSQE